MEGKTQRIPTHKAGVQQPFHSYDFFATWYIITVPVHFKDQMQEKHGVFSDAGLQRFVLKMAVRITGHITELP